MNRLTSEERRRVYRAQQRAEPGPGRVMLAAVIGAMLGASVVLAWQVLEFHPPSSMVEALLPRL